MAALDTDVDPLALERQVCFALAVTNRAVLAVYRPLLEPLGLTHPQYLVMLALWDHQKSPAVSEPLSVKDIALALQLDSATLSPMLKRLAALGLITRTRSAADERSTGGRRTTGRRPRRTRGPARDSHQSQRRRTSGGHIEGRATPMIRPTLRQY